MLKKLALAAVGALVAATLTACGGGGDSASGVSSDCKPAHEGLTTASEGSLTTATYNFPPFTTVSGTEVGGPHGDIPAEIAKMECLNLWDSRLTPAPLSPPPRPGGWTSLQETGIAPRSGQRSSTWPALSTGTYSASCRTLARTRSPSSMVRSVVTVDGYNYKRRAARVRLRDAEPCIAHSEVRRHAVRPRHVAVDSYGSALHANEQSGNKFKVEVVKARSACAGKHGARPGLFPHR